MAKYTIELRRICDILSRSEVESWFSSYNLKDYLLPDQLEILNKSSWTKEKLAKQIVDHFYMREIGFETPFLFKHYALCTMNEIMQEYLPLIYTTVISYDPLINVNYTETFERNASGNSNSTGNSSSNSTSNSEGMNIINDTPQTNINKQDINSGAYASNVNQSDTSSNIQDNTNTSSQGNSNTNEKYIRHFEGNQGISATYQAMIKQFRDNIVAYNNDIINRLQTLFMGLY